ncbi:winged helix-turn-helix domain-containing protein [Haloarcula laminariae]|jgi:Fe2+ or Zn2+ uptake regulation protein|uniref:winged helix-turn-helix domain-containing protein n=1 Tax=Haloarcula laminariae TaxID=2961577 RepID=UPI002405A9D6|nr:winged helix-turn-helix domain-containing protein [Halomicroarcula sp. FL173]
MAQTSSEAFADNAPLMELFGTPARTRIVSVFVDEKDFDLNVSEIADQAGVARSTVYDHLEGLEDLGVIKPTRETGNSSRYQLNTESPIAERLHELEGLVLKQSLQNRDDIEF